MSLLITMKDLCNLFYVDVCRLTKRRVTKQITRRNMIC